MASRQGIKAGDAYVILGLEADGVTKDMAEFAAEFEDLGSKMVRAGAFGAALFGATAGAIGWSAKEAGLYHAALRRIELTYGSLAGEQRQWMEDFQSYTLRGKKQIAEMIATFGGFTKGLGFADKDAAALARGLARISSSMATFASISLQESAQRFRSAMAGSSEVLDMLGINIKEAALNQALLELGFGKISDGATEQQKILARYMIILGAMKAQGSDLADITMWTLPRAFEVLKGAFNDFLVAAGEPFLNIVVGLVQGAASLTRGISQLTSRYPSLIRLAAMAAFMISGFGASMTMAGGAMLLMAKYASTSAVMLQVYAAAANTAASSNVRFVASGFRMAILLNKMAIMGTALVAALGILAVATDSTKDGMSNLATGWETAMNKFSAEQWIDGMEAMLTTIQVGLIQIGNALLMVLGWIDDGITWITKQLELRLQYFWINFLESVPASVRKFTLFGSIDEELRRAKKGVVDLKKEIKDFEEGKIGTSALDPNNWFGKEIKKGQDRADEMMDQYRRDLKARRASELAERQREIEEEEKRIREMADKIRGATGTAIGSARTATAVTFRSVQGWETAYQNQQAALGVLERIVYVSEENRDANKETAEAVKNPKPAVAGVD